MADDPEPKTSGTGKPAVLRPGEGKERIAKVMARAGLSSRRGAEAIIEQGRVTLNGKTLDTPAVTVGPGDDIRVDGKPLPRAEPTRLWRYHKPPGLLTTNRDDDGRPTIFDRLPDTIPRVITVGRLDMNTEGLLLLTNDGELARYLELPETGWLRRYRVRAYGRIDQPKLDTLASGPLVEGVKYGPVIAKIERETGDNVWLNVDLREGKNREVKRVLASVGLEVNRLIRVSYGPFTLEQMARGEVTEIPRRILKEQIPDRFRNLGETGGQARGSKAKKDDDRAKPQIGRSRTAPNKSGATIQRATSKAKSRGVSRSGTDASVGHKKTTERSVNSDQEFRRGKNWKDSSTKTKRSATDTTILSKPPSRAKGKSAQTSKSDAGTRRPGVGPGRGNGPKRGQSKGGRDANRRR